MKAHDGQEESNTVSTKFTYSTDFANEHSHKCKFTVYTVKHILAALHCMLLLENWHIFLFLFPPVYITNYNVGNNIWSKDKYELMLMSNV